MDALEQAMALRAASAMQALTGDLPTTRKQKAAFLEITKATMLETDPRRQRAAVEGLAGHPNEYVSKAATAARNYGEDLNGADGPLRAMADAWIASIAEQSALDMLARYAVTLPPGTRRVTLAAGDVADQTTEGFPIAVRRPGLNHGDVAMTKSTALTVMTKEFAMTGGDAVLALIDRELGASITRAVNRGVAEHFTDSNAITIPISGDALADLRAGLQAAGPSQGYVVIAAAGVVADLACRAEAGPNFGIRGGEFKPGVWVCAIDDDSQPLMVIPASRCAVFGGGLEVRPAGHASVQMSDSPTGAAAEMVSLFQTGSVGLLAERQWHIGGDAVAVLVEGS